MNTTSKKKILIFLISITYFSIINAQTTIILQPEGNQGKDAYIESRLNNENFGSHIDFPSISWTNSGTPVDSRGLIDFDLSSIPDGATIHSASLSLYSYNSPANGSHSTQSGSNESVLTRITSSWDENTVNWNNQPTTTTQNQVFLPASTNSIQNYLNIDVTNLIQDMINDPNNSYGFLLKLVTEQRYRRMIFASSDNPDSTLHPKLEVSYSIASSTPEDDCGISISNDTTFCSPTNTNCRLGVSPSSGTFFWNTGATTDSITVAPTTTTTYYVTVTADNCTYQDSVKVTVGELGFLRRN